MKISNGFTLFMVSSLLLVFTSCYRMPTDDDFSVVPTTNNPAVTLEKNDAFIPGVGY